jgi:hypothetical protein
MKVAVFLGPTLPVADARARLDALYLPPAAMGDVYDLVAREQPDVIAIVDGYFDSVPSVWHKEILYALSCGIRVAGASSMGALRAAELWTFGMEGVGWVFEAFRSGALEDDDEVAVLHGDADTGYLAVSTAMVNLRVGLARAGERGLIAAPTCDTMIALAKRCHYPDRSWDRLLQDAAGHGLPAGELGALRTFVDAEQPDVKREDACTLLERLAAPAERPATARASAPVELAPTIFWDRLTRGERRRGLSSAAGVRAEELRRFVKATERDLESLRRDSLLFHLVEKECEFLGIELTQTQFDAAVRDFRLRQNLVSAASLRSWIERAQLTSDEFRALMEQEARLAALLNVHAGDIDARLLDALALSGRLADALARKAAGEERARASAAARRPAPSAPEVETFYRARVRQFAGSLQGHARDLGFASGRELIDEIRKIYEPRDS